MITDITHLTHTYKFRKTEEPEETVYIFMVKSEFTINRKNPIYTLVKAFSVSHAIELWIADHKEHAYGVNRGVVRVYDSCRKLLAKIDARVDFSRNQSFKSEILADTLKDKRKRKKSLEKDRLLRINYSRENSLLYKAMKLRKELNKLNKL